MSGAKHTDGPWSMEGPDPFGDYNIHEPTARLDIGAVVSNLRPPKVVEANARLIAAAPDMLAALQLHQAWSDSDNAGPDYGGMTRATHPEGDIVWRKWWTANCDLYKRAQDATRAAISRATGANHEH